MSPLVVDLADAALWHDPYPTWRAARDAGRTAVSTSGEVIVLRADDVDLVQTHPAFVQPGLANLDRLGIHDGPIREWRRRTMAAVDGADHARLRGLVARSFTPRRVERVRDGLRDHVGVLLDGLVGAGEIDVVSDVARSVPLWLICEFLGLPAETGERLEAGLTGTEEAFADPMTPERRRRAEQGIVDLYGLVEELVDRHRSDGPTLIGDLLDAETAGAVDRDELLALLVNVVGGAVGSSRAGIANSILVLLRHPVQADRVREDPDLLAPAVEECLRFHPPFRWGRRRVAAPTDALGVALAEGDSVFVARQAANRDPDRWVDPERFDIARPEQRHYSFGYGAHFCIGQALARLDVQETVGAFLRRFPRAELLDADPPRVPFTADEQLDRLGVRVG